MKRCFWLLLMLLLAACGGGSSSTQSGPPSGGTTSGAGTVSLQFVDAKAGALKSARFTPQLPGRVRIVFTNNSLNFKKVVDIALGTVLGQIGLPAADDYKVQAIYYANGTPNELISYGTTQTLIDVQPDGVTAATITMNSIAVPLTEITGGVQSGATYDYVEPDARLLTGQGLQTSWSLAYSVTPFSDRLHLAQSATGSHIGLKAPVVATSGSLYFQGEFFIQQELLQTGESASNWTFVTEPPTPTALNVISFDLGIGLPSDTTPPKVTELVVPSGKVGAPTFPIDILATDNAAISSYLITETAGQPAVTDSRWSAVRPTSYTYVAPATNPLIHGEDNTVHLYAWVKDPSNNVSLLAAGVSEKTVTLNCSPVVTSFTVPQASQFDGVDIPVTVLGKSFDADGTLVPETPDNPIYYLITTTATEPAAADPNWQADPPASYTVNLVQAPGASYNATLYAWVKDSHGVSDPVINAVRISDKPAVTSFVATPPSTGKVITGISITADVASGSIAGYAITTSSLNKPSSFSAEVPASYTYPYALTSGVAVTKKIYAWVKDSSGRISEPVTLSVRFSNP